MKGVNYIPQDVFLPRVKKTDYEDIISAAVDANMNMIRVWGGGIYEDDLFYDLQIPYALAALGGTIEVPTLDGKISLKIPAGTQSNKTFRLKNHGMPNLRYSSRKGDLYVKISILVPTKLSKEQKDSLIQFAKSCGEENFSETDGFLGKAKKFFESD